MKYWIKVRNICSMYIYVYIYKRCLLGELVFVSPLWHCQKFLSVFICHTLTYNIYKYIYINIYIWDKQKTNPLVNRVVP